MSTVSWFCLIDVNEKGGKVGMATRQYIGARYVPKFYNNPNGTNDWLTGIPYEALTIVTYSDIQFISKKPVPANIGTPNENTEYWLVNSTGGSGDLTPILNDIQGLKTSVGNIDSDIENIQKDISDINKELNTNRGFYILMDSWGDPLFNGNYQMIEKIKEYAGITGLWYGRGHAGGGFGQPELGNNFKNDVNVMRRDIPENEWPLITDVYIFAGANDYDMNGTDIINGIGDFISYLHQYFPNAKVKIGAVSNTMQGSKVANGGKVVENYQKCNIYGATYLNNSEWVFRRFKDYDNTLSHPNASGSDYLAKQLAKFIHNDNIDVLREIIITPKPTDIFRFTAENKPFKMVQHNGTVNCYSQIAGGQIIRGTFSPDQTTNIDLQLNIDDTFIVSGSTQIKTLNVNAMAGISDRFIATSSISNFMVFDRPHEISNGLTLRIRVFNDPGNTIHFLDVFSQGTTGIL